MKTTALLLGFVACFSTTFAADLFVAPDGNDANPGTRARPFATLERARDEARKLKATDAVTVHLRGGRYELAKPLEFTAADSGTADRPVVWQAWKDEQPVVSGGARVTGWRKHDANIWFADVPWVRERGQPFYQLFVNGQRRARARTPNEGYFYTRRLRMQKEGNEPELVCVGFTYAEGDLTPALNTPDTTIVLFHNWVNSFNRIGAFDAERRRVTFRRPAGIFFLGSQMRYYVENAFAALDAPGEWFLDTAKGLLFYRPMPGEDLARAEVIAPRVGSPMVRFTGTPETGPFVEHLTLRGISFQHADANLAPDYPHSVQGAHFQNGALLAVGLRRAVIEDCEFTRLGEHGVSLLEGCASNAVRRCHFHDLGGGGVYLSKEWPRKHTDAWIARDNVVDNNFIHDGGHLFRAGCGVFLGGSASFNRITHNEICDLSWMGVHAGWSWTGREATWTHHNEIAWNHIHHLGNGVLNDIGGIYTLGVQPGTVLHHNHIHDVTRFERGAEGYGGWGIYLDAGSSEIRVENNVVHDTRDGGFHAHSDGHPYGDAVANNIFAYAGEGQLMRNNNKEPETNHVHLERNLVVNHSAKMFSGGNWNPGTKVTLDRNLYWSETTNAPDFYGRTFAEWRKLGRDSHSVIADPRFVNAAQRDFRLRADSPALALGFQPIDLREAGLHGPAKWRALPQSLKHRAVERATLLPQDLVRRDDYEGYDVGEVAEGALPKDGGTSATVSDQTAATGRQSLRFVDAAEGTGWKPHWCVWRTASLENPRPVRLQCSVKSDAAQPGLFELEARDWHGSQKGDAYLTGPHLRFQPDGTIEVAGANGWTKLGQAPLDQWLRVEIEFAEAGRSPTYSLRVNGPDGFTIAKADLPFRSGAAFKLCTWFGLSGTGAQPAVFYLDDVNVE